MLYRIKRFHAGPAPAGGPVPVHLRKRIIPFADQVYGRDEAGEWLVQQFDWNGLGLEQVWFGLQQDCRIEVHSPGPVVVLLCLMQGAFLLNRRSPGPDHSFREATCSLVYVPAGAHRVRLARQDHSCLLLRYSLHWLDRLDTSYPDIRELLLQARSGNPLCFRAPAAPLTRPVRSRIREILDCREESPQREIFLEMHMKSLLLHYTRYLAARRRNQVTGLRNGHRAETITRYLQENLEEKLTINGVSRVFGVSSTYLKQFFRSQLNSSFHRFLLELRLQEAHRLLSSTEEPVASIAQQCGFSDHSHLIRRFKARFGYGPSELRKKG